MSWIVRVANLNIHTKRFKTNIETHSFKYIKTAHSGPLLIEREYSCSKCKTSLCIYRGTTVRIISYDDYKPWSYSCEELIMLKVLK